jgi:hypothetical protein
LPLSLFKRLRKTKNKTETETETEESRDGPRPMRILRLFRSRNQTVMNVDRYVMMRRMAEAAPAAKTVCTFAMVVVMVLEAVLSTGPVPAIERHREWTSPRQQLRTA